nr:MAG TPA: hypothetical protein [Caudoviricetes sp.]
MQSTLGLYSDKITTEFIIILLEFTYSLFPKEVRCRIPYLLILDHCYSANRHTIYYSLCHSIPLYWSV